MTIRETFPYMAKVVREGSQGLARIEHFRVSEHEVMMAAWHGERGTDTRKTYAKLTVGGKMMMSDTDMERGSNYGVVSCAKGDVLLGGLGLGMIVHPILAKREVTSVTIIEKFADVIALVAPSLKDVRVTVICADMMLWLPPKGQKWDTIYFDIWPDMCTDNLDDIAVLHRRFARRKNPGGWMDSWQSDMLRYRRRQEKAAGW